MIQLSTQWQRLRPRNYADKASIDCKWNWYQYGTIWQYLRLYKCLVGGLYRFRYGNVQRGKEGFVYSITRLHTLFFLPEYLFIHHTIFLMLLTNPFRASNPCHFHYILRHPRLIFAYLPMYLKPPLYPTSLKSKEGIQSSWRMKSPTQQLKILRSRW